ncbi:hypothetical protein M413DRAFT_408142 [Hebeloma cylindrosporum]|uniref:Uncharacterized protein n=1 Tax=Hebeloma cylindrosporum TaxID=76867 RepID=A0A0C2Z9K8_HEBCY|nr:hypothetical protein M413DRAFT_408142 [Hebeloma cylindrosporum h7]
MEDLESTHFNPFRDPSFVRKVVKEPQAQVESDESNPRWQPKITLYRLLVISTTISLGSAKAVAVFYGKSYVSITIEWIAGVAVSIFLYILGLYESNPFNMMPYLFEIHYDNQVYSGGSLLNLTALASPTKVE